MGEAIFGLVGVVVGGLLTAGAEAWRETRRDKRNATLAKKLLLSELFNARIIFQLLSTSTKTWPAFPSVDAILSTDIWNDHRSSLIEQFDKETWEHLHRCYVRIAVHKAQMIDSANDPVSTQDVENLTVTVGMIDQIRSLSREPSAQ